jgi:dTDP-4-dehydrorhamnose 3,5-epimerase
MHQSATPIPDVKVIQPQVFGDERGFFMETWHHEKFTELGIPDMFVQDNHSRSKRGILRGLHYQICHPQGKLVRVIRGEVFDVAVDLRKSSATRGKWVGEYLSEENKKMMWVPPGFAHGFLVTSEEADLVYKCTDVYTPECERTIVWSDPDLSIQWPLQQGQQPLVSAKDSRATRFRDAELFE